jgi:hypothetical protein
MNWILDVSPRRAIENLAIPREKDDVALLNLIESEVAPFDPKAPTLLVSDGNVSPDHVRLTGDL